MNRAMWTAVRTCLVLTVLTGILYPLAVWGAGRLFFASQAEGSLVVRNGRVIGSRLLAQAFHNPRYFHPRPSATDYDGTRSGATNLSPTSNRLVHGDPASHFLGVEQLAEQVRRENNLPPNAPVPVDAVTRSASGLDPAISIAYANLQARRIARARGIGVAIVRECIAKATTGRFLGIFGEPCVNVLKANLLLDNTR